MNKILAIEIQTKHNHDLILSSSDISKDTLMETAYLC